MAVPTPQAAAQNRRQTKAQCLRLQAVLFLSQEITMIEIIRKLAAKDERDYPMNEVWGGTE